MFSKEFIIFLITYIISTIIRGIAGISFIPFMDNFDLVLFLKDIGIWTVTYIIVRIAVNKFIKMRRA